MSARLANILSLITYKYTCSSTANNNAVAKKLKCTKITILIKHKNPLCRIPEKQSYTNRL